VVFVGKSVSGKRLAAAVLLLMPLAAHAAGLGKLTVLSQLGQPLNAEIEIVSLQPGEEETLSAKIASQDAFGQAGIEFTSALMGVRFAVERKGGKPVIRMTSQQPMNEPFLEVLVEMQWATGRLVREYSFLLDPPEYKGPQPIAAKPAPGVVEKPAASAPSRPEERPIAAAPAPKPSAAPAAAPSAASKPAAGTYEVKKGDTLGKIAGQNLQPGVSMQQMLAALYRANQDAFINGNINLLRSGRILTVPDRDTAAAIDQAEAAKLVSAQSSAFAEYQQKAGAAVAVAPVARPAPKQQAAGPITPKPAPVPAAPKDQLKLSKADPAKPAAPAAKASRGDDAVARDRALKEAQSRVSDLEKNVGDLQKLLELKNQQLAALEKKAAADKPAAAKPEPPKPEPAKAEPPKVAPKPEAAKAEPPKPEPAKAEPPKPAPEAPKTEVAKADAPKDASSKDAPKDASQDAPKDAAKDAPKPAAEAPKPAAEAPKPKPKPAPPPPPPPPPSVVDQFLDNPLALGGLGGVAALLAGYGAWAWRRKKATQSKFQDSVLGAASAAGGTASVLNAGAADPSEAASVSGASVSDASVGGAEADDVDPIAEADVYMAYGRDAQAEEILREALVKDASRTNVYGKLLEIYANRRDAKSFEQSAVKLKSLTGGEGVEWDKAAALGRSIDPGNGLYGGSGDAAPLPAAAPAAAAPTLDFDIGGGGDAGAASTDLSLDLGVGTGDAAVAPASVDFDLGGGEAEPAAEQTDFAPTGTLIVDSTQRASLSEAGLDFDLGGDTPAPAGEAPAPAPATDSGGMDFDLNLDLGGGTAEAPAAAPADAAIDLSGLSLELGGAPSGDAGGVEAGSEKWQEVATKLDLAKAYEEMGDKDGARDLLNEVVKEGDAAQQAQAQQMLAALG